MSAFGRRNGLGAGQAARPAFGVARPMQGGGAQPAADAAEQFPPLPDTNEIDADQSGNMPGSNGDAMARLTERQNSSGEAAGMKAEGFEASVHRIKEQVLPRLLERVDPEAAATLNKDELAEEFRPIISEVLTELKINLNRREQFAVRHAEMRAPPAYLPVFGEIDLELGQCGARSCVPAPLGKAPRCHAASSGGCARTRLIAVSSAAIRLRKRCSLTEASTTISIARAPCSISASPSGAGLWRVDLEGDTTSSCRERPCPRSTSGRVSQEASSREAAKNRGGA